jgi:hypothetical protein
VERSDLYRGVGKSTVQIADPSEIGRTASTSYSMIESQKLVTKVFDSSALMIDPLEVAALLGYPDGKQVPPKVLGILPELQARAVELFQPMYQYAIFPIRSIDQEEQTVTLESMHVFHGEGVVETLRYSTQAAIFLVTLGHPIIEEIERLNRVDVSKGFFLDVISSVAVENLAEQVHLEIAHLILGQGLYVGHRYSPGFCDWDLTQQRVMFSLLDSSVLSVQLTDHCMMIPRKSVSAIFGAGRERVEMVISPCGYCKRTDCMARREDYMNILYQSEESHEPL